MSLRTRLALAVAAIALGTPAARAATGFDLERLTLDPAARGSLLVGNGEVAPEGGYRVGAALQFQRQPLVLQQNGSVVGNGYPTRAAEGSAIVANRYTLHLGAAYTVFHRLELSAKLPVVVNQSADLRAGGVAPESSGLGTPAFGLRYGVLAQDAGMPLSFAVAGEVLAPWGSTGALAGQEDTAFTARVEVGRRFGGLLLAVQGGALLRTREVAVPNEKPLGNELTGGLAIATTGALRLEASARGSYGLQNERKSLQELIGLRYAAGPVEIFALGGPGFGHQPGNPQWLGLVGIALAGDPRPPQLEEARVDPPVAPPKPVAAPAPAPVVAVAAPPAPVAPPVAPPAPPKAAKARLAGPKIEITEAIYFRFGDYEVAERSHDLLDDVVAVIKAHPEITRVVVEGHTDDRGDPAVNRKLSLGRARAVRAYLVEHGIEESRIVAKGFGPDRPVASNATKAGRERNRRVDFFATWRVPKGAKTAAAAQPPVPVAKK